MTIYRLLAYFGLAAALAGCGAQEPLQAQPSTPPPAASTESPSAESPSAAPPAAATRTIKLEVLGKGRAMQPIMYMADEDGTENNATLPWSRTATIELTGAEQRVGRLVSVVSGSVQDASGQLKPAACRITVDGKKVASGTGLCKYKIK
ncbi:MmpS family protein [Nonomuraea aurantiaca]|uniref:MmpS family protein n=1 Tax=Nonomuraea aurantiaca TaxID=2878562 RepID=UPI001CD9A2B2|nr:MmpS family protein [Nonomuraea aurantiaca]MCA2222605.1 MmpS family protein [Nonomuraea aurantiaca]